MSDQRRKHKKGTVSAPPAAPLAPATDWWSSRRAIWLAIAVIVCAAAAVYANSVLTPFVFDDRIAITDNPTIHNLWQLGTVLQPPANGAAVQRRPIVNVSLAVNYAISDLDVWSYHVMNIVIHALTALLLFGLIRRTLLLPTQRERWGAVATPLAFAAALIWTVHPLLTEAVTYIIQRTESVAALFYLLTLYCVLRGATAGRAWPWFSGAVAASALAMGSKEAAISAPILAAVYDRLFLSASWRELWRRRWGLYAGLAATWLVIIAVLPHGAEKTAIFRDGSQVLSYASAQFGVIAHYLWLCFWPHPLVVDYGMYEPLTAGEIIPYALLIAALWAGIIWAFFRQPWLGFLGLFFFAILAPSSSLVPLPQQVAAEKRMYLPSAAVVTAAVIGAYLFAQRLVQRGRLSAHAARIAGVSLVAGVVVVFGALTIRRNMDYRTSISIWEDAAAKLPNNGRAHNNLAGKLADADRFADAMREYQIALRLLPKDASCHYCCGLACEKAGLIDQAIALYRKAVQLNPDYKEAHYKLGLTLAKLRHPKGDKDNNEEVLTHLRRALELQLAAPKSYGIVELPDIYCAIGMAHWSRQEFADAVAAFQQALHYKPDFASAHFSLGNALASQNRFTEAIDHYRRSRQLDAKNIDAWNNLGAALRDSGQYDDAIAELQALQKAHPEYPKAAGNLQKAVDRREKLRAAVAQERAALQTQPHDVARLNKLARTLAANPNASIRNGAEAVALAQRALAAAGNQNPLLLDTLAAAYAEAGDFTTAAQTARQAAALAQQQNNPALRHTIQAHLQQYEARTPLRESEG